MLNKEFDGAKVCGDGGVKVCCDGGVKVCGDDAKGCGDGGVKVCCDGEAKVCGDGEAKVCGDGEAKVCGDDAKGCGDGAKVCGDGVKVCGDGAKVRVVSTKVSARMYARMKALLEGKGLSIYDFLSGCCSLVVSYLDNPHDISTEMAVAIQLFEGIDRFKHGFMLNGITPYTVSDAIYFIHAKGKTGGHGVLIENGQAGGDDRVPGQALMLSGEHDSLFRFEDFNRQHILERAIEGTTPELYRRLRLLGVQMGTSSFLETLTRLVETELQDPVTHEVQKDFADDARVRTRTGTWVTMGEQARAITHRRRG